ncbi:MAG: hypothetical protein A2637_05140 [Candidatus Muproteobacteria bacterium RIFCSPHIGHO2_01_FULL_65_16]|uniref:Uncharacterized protein n=1 Tax=Candidatus Muproteobacteria bacterium RIFCSPHIGHO2_01_FULL_65_16 TaxID=1817764 RepID=A0A1F6TSA8_9PROT|nr:MAG: hypothetical protein A2637_05140 [Candidatus Muproteobacteria bacterium RIFCSPHIGHO2_01_FULL_65_16]
MRANNFLFLFNRIFAVVMRLYDCLCMIQVVPVHVYLDAAESKRNHPYCPDVMFVEHERGNPFHFKSHAG